jgi:hypothetical protein
VLLLERYEHWRQWSPERRRAVREGLRNYREMSPQQRQEMRRSLRALRMLDPAARERLREQWRSLTPEQRRAWLHAGGPGLAPPPTQ